MAQGQLTPEELVDRYRLQCKPVRDLLVDYLRERQPALDYASLPAFHGPGGPVLGQDLEAPSRHRHAAAAARRRAAWKEDLQTKRSRHRPDGQQTVVTSRGHTEDELIRVRALYLDIAQWATGGTGTLGAVGGPEPGQRRRESTGPRNAAPQGPDGPADPRAAARPARPRRRRRPRNATAGRLQAAHDTPPGEIIEGTAGRCAGRSRPRPTAGTSGPRTPPPASAATCPTRKKRRSGPSPTVEVLRRPASARGATGAHHHSITEYRLPATGELVPLLQIAPSKTDTECLLVSPELADVLSAIIARVRGPPVPSPSRRLRRQGTDLEPSDAADVPAEHREREPGIHPHAIRNLLIIALAATGLTDAAGDPLMFTPHDFRRIFTTEAVLNGMPPHIAQLILGHKDINTTMGYKAVYPEEAINSHRAFIARRRALRPSEEYRAPTDSEWEEFLGHFERRRLALGDCGRASAPAASMSFSCVRCPLLRVDPAQRPRLEKSATT